MMIPEVEKHEFKSAIIVGIEVQLFDSIAAKLMTSRTYASYKLPSTSSAVESHLTS